jgi:hypothetical protein
MFLNRNFLKVKEVLFLFFLPCWHKTVHAKESSSPDDKRPVLQGQFAIEPLITIYSHGGHRSLTRQAFEKFVQQRAAESLLDQLHPTGVRIRGENKN